MNAIHTAIEVSGNASSLARALGVSVQAVCFWRDGGRQVPAEKCPDIERLTFGRVRCEDLRPDVDWAFLRKSRRTRTARPDPEAGHV